MRFPIPSSARRRWAKWLAVLAIYSLIVGCVNLADRLVIFPTTYPIDPDGAVRRAVPFQGGDLEAWTAVSPAAARSQPEAFVLRFYGNADRAERWVTEEAQFWAPRPVEVWGVNYPGFGGSTGPARVASIGPAALAAFDALKAHAGDRPIFVFGASIGTTAALHVAANRPVAGAILHNPPALREMILREHGWWNLWLLAVPVARQIPRDLDSVANAKAARGPAVFLLAEKDEVVAPKYHRLVADAYGGEKRVILLRDATHNAPIEGASLEEFRAAIDWLMPRPR
jgi:pimeloyl-ACP methyl ester carboxylesterase